MSYDTSGTARLASGRRVVTPILRQRTPTARRENTQAQDPASCNYDKLGYKYRYFFNESLPKYGHMDVVCAWDQGQQELDSYELASNVTYSSRARISYMRSQKMKSGNSEGALDTAEAEWKKFTSMTHKQLDLDIVREYIVNLRPLSVHDFKPMLILMQAVLKLSMDEEVEKVSAKVLEENDETIRGYLSKIKTVEAEVVEQKVKNQELKVKGERCTTLQGEVTSLNLEIEQLKAVIKKAEEEKNPRSRLSARAAKK